MTQSDCKQKTTITTDEEVGLLSSTNDDKEHCLTYEDMSLRHLREDVSFSTKDIEARVQDFDSIDDSDRHSFFPPRTASQNVKLLWILYREKCRKKNKKAASFRQYLTVWEGPHHFNLWNAVWCLYALVSFNLFVASNWGSLHAISIDRLVPNVLFLILVVIRRGGFNSIAATPWVLGIPSILLSVPIIHGIIPKQPLLTPMTGFAIDLGIANGMVLTNWDVYARNFDSYKVTALMLAFDLGLILPGMTLFSTSYGMDDLQDTFHIAPVVSYLAAFCLEATLCMRKIPRGVLGPFTESRVDFVDPLLPRICLLGFLTASGFYSAEWIGETYGVYVPFRELLFLSCEFFIIWKIVEKYKRC